MPLCSLSSDMTLNAVLLLESKTENLSAGNSPSSFDKRYFANATAVPGPRAVELSVEVLSRALQIMFL